MNHEEFESAILVRTYVQVTEPRTHRASLKRTDNSTNLFLEDDPAIPESVTPARKD
jgi:hypothetical protein